MAEKIFTGVVVIIVGSAAIALVSVAYAFPVMWLWNWLMPEIFGLKVISLWQSLGLTFLCSLLFKSSSSSSSK